MKTLLATAAIATALFTAAPAGADQWDFISRLDAAGVPYSDILDMIDLGKQTCHALRAGSDIDTMVDDLVQKMYFADYEAATILGAASMSMCPDTLPRMREYVNSPVRMA